MVTTHRTGPEDFERVLAFYCDNHYAPTISPDDVIVVAETEGALCGAVRLCDERGVLVLRGMRISERLRGRGIGTRLLQTLEPLVGDRECFCIPFRYLRGFYGCIGFAEIEIADAPTFLRERCAAYRRDGLDVIVMRRPAATGTDHARPG